MNHITKSLSFKILTNDLKDAENLVKNGTKEDAEKNQNRLQEAKTNFRKFLEGETK